MKSSSGNPSAVRVTRNWTATYHDPISIRRGEPVTLTGREDMWHGHRWLWAVARDGREGWVPDSLIDGDRARQDYSAMELTCRAGDRLVTGASNHGWTWCTNPVGREGWVPEECLTPD